MYKIAFIGADSTHTEAFGEIINGPKSKFLGVAKVISIWGKDFLQAQEKSRSIGIERVCHTVEEALEGVDIAMVIGRFGDDHFLPASISLNMSIPTFIDKPYTSTLEEARSLNEMAIKHNTLLASSSPLRFCKEIALVKEIISRSSGEGYAIVSIPLNCIDLGSDPRLNSAFFYGIHGVEMLLELISSRVIDFMVEKKDFGIEVKVLFQNGKFSFLKFIQNMPEDYLIEFIDGDKFNKVKVELDGSYYLKEVEMILSDFIQRKPFIPIESSISAIEILEGVETLNKKFRGRDA
jgi:hypothetical protein